MRKLALYTVTEKYKFTMTFNLVGRYVDSFGTVAYVVKFPKGRINRAGVNPSNYYIASPDYLKSQLFKREGIHVNGIKIDKDGKLSFVSRQNRELVFTSEPIRSYAVTDKVMSLLRQERALAYEERVLTSSLIDFSNEELFHDKYVDCMQAWCYCGLSGSEILSDYDKDGAYHAVRGKFNDSILSPDELYLDDVIVNYCTRCNGSDTKDFSVHTSFSIGLDGCMWASVDILSGLHGEDVLVSKEERINCKFFTMDCLLQLYTLIGKALAEAFNKLSKL